MYWALSATSAAIAFVTYFAWATAVEDDRTGTQIGTLITAGLFWLFAVAAILLLAAGCVRWYRRRRRMPVTK
jgi:hypothetical protein